MDSMSHTQATQDFPEITLGSKEKPFKNEYGVELPGITGDSQRAVVKLLDKNDKKFDIFFNDKGFHNHCVHHLLAAYSCGASPKLLDSIYKKFEEYLRPRLPSKIKITKENWTQHFGKDDLFTDYLEFFEGEIKEKGMQKTFEEYGLQKEMFARLFGGAFHPIIHVGYGIEFQIPLILAEGLAETAIHKNRLTELLNDSYFSKKDGNKRIIDIVNDIIKDDQEFKSFLTHDVDKKLQKVVDEKVDPIKKYCSQWKIEETEEGVKQATRELFEALILLYGATSIRPDKKTIRLDFFLMHGVTSMLFVYIALPHVSLDFKVKMLKSELAAALVYFVARGRPKLHLDALKNYKPERLQDEPNPWLDILKNSLLEDAEPHVIKVIRSLLKAEQEWGPRDDNLYIKIAQLTVEGYEKYGWSMNGNGFDQEWDEKP